MAYSIPHLLSGVPRVRQHHLSPTHAHSQRPARSSLLGNGIRYVLAAQDRELLTFLKRTEEYLVDYEAIQGVGFRFVGSV
ncbi:MAG: hypothetical protein ACJ8CB_13975 [Ktedonobacteraceae bacterium]